MSEYAIVIRFTVDDDAQAKEQLEEIENQAHENGAIFDSLILYRGDDFFAGGGRV